MIGDMPGADRARLRFRSPVGLLLALAATGLACARRSEFIGTVRGTDGGGGDARAADAGGSDGADDGGAGDAGDPAAFLCTPDNPPPPAVNEPIWNCPGGRTRCLLADPAINPALFDGAALDQTLAPALVYPLAGSMYPLNLPGLTVQWTRPPGEGQTTFLVQVASTTQPTNRYEFFVPYQAPDGMPSPAPKEWVVYPIPGPVWRWIGSQNAGAEVTITVTGLDPVANKKASSAPVSIRFSAAAIEGGLFYLAVPEQTVWRQVFGAAAEPRAIVTLPVAGVPGLDCAGCHSISRDGRRMAFSATYGGDLTVVDTSNPALPLPAPTKPTTADANAVAPALSPDGRFVFARRAVPDGDVELRESATGRIIDRKDVASLGGRIDYPEWSPTRSEIVASRAEGPGQPPESSYTSIDGRIVIIPITQGAADPTIGTPVAVATASPTRTYGNPTFSPDGKWIVFVSRPAGQNSRGSVATRLHLQRIHPPGDAVDLGLAVPSDSASTYPKFAPTALNHCNTFFLTFQSRMDYGLVRVTSRTADIAWPQLWMTSIDLTKLIANPVSDPSSRPLWLPFQKITSKNLLPSWSAQIPCNATNPCGGGATCTGGLCAVNIN